MKLVSPDIAWHGQRQFILSIDFHPFTNQFVTGGSQQKVFSEQKDSQFFSGCVKIWQLNQDKLMSPQCKYGLAEITASVNCAKYSPDGRFLAVATDGKEIVIFQQKECNRSFSSLEKMMRWGTYCRFFGHGQDVIDLSWNRKADFLASASMDGTVKFWSMEKRKESKNIGTFNKSVQGVAMHPNIQFIIAVGNDQTAKMFNPTTGNKKSRPYDNWYVKKCFEKYHFDKGVLQEGQIDNQNQSEKKQSFKMFANESVASFFRRPSISPDGQLFILPCGIYKGSHNDDPKCCAYLFRKNYFSKPSFALQTNKQPVLITKFCPILFHKKNPEEGLFKQPYYMIFAVATTNSVLIYSTDSMKPLYGMGNFHYAALTDLTWKDDRVLAVSSSDGFISFFTFQKGELGQVYYPQEGLLRDMITRTPYVPQKKQNTQANKMVPQVQQQQQTIINQTAQGVKKKIIPKIISKAE